MTFGVVPDGVNENFDFDGELEAGVYEIMLLTRLGRERSARDSDFFTVEERIVIDESEAPGPRSPWDQIVDFLARFTG